MTCEELLRLTAFSLGELEPGERQRARDHLAGCDDCASRVLMDRQLTALLRTSAVPAPEATRTAVLAAVRAEAHEHASRSAPLPERAGGGASPAGRPGAGTGSPWPRPWWGPPPWSPRPCWWCRPPTRAARCRRPGAPTTTRARTGWAAPARPRPSGCSPSSGRPRAPRPGDLRPPQGRLGGTRPGRARGRGGRVPRRRPTGGSRSCAGGATCPGWPRAPRAASWPPTWGRHTSYWWRADGVVWCLVGTIDQDRLYKIAEALGGES